MTKTHRQRPQAEFVTDEEQRLLEIEDMRLAVKFGNKRRFSARERAAIYQELVDASLDDEARRDPDAIEAVFKKLNAADEAEAARRDLGGWRLSPQWCAHVSDRAKRGLNTSTCWVNGYGGRYFDSEWPPGYEPSAILGAKP
jgi:hypothetical protein